MCASSNVLVLLTTERFFAIIFPLRHMQYSHTNRWVIALIALLPAQILIFYFHLRPYIDAETFIVFEDGVCYPQAVWNVQVINVPFHLSLFIIPLFIIVFVNFVIAVKLRQQRKSRVRSTKSADGNNKTLWILPMVYAALSAPSFTLSLVKKFDIAPLSLYEVIDVAHELLFHINMLDFAYNWLLYAMTRYDRLLMTWLKSYISVQFDVSSDFRFFLVQNVQEDSIGDEKQCES
ncbi:7 transmembrane receptor (rhodopsin family) domain-containing protein [Ditylenchus destructor]|uniref:7 transmembrane receptor (Rhodopsin family) domain-containing protein n=1 Tax=Ditylenchus destructor TaxID=166010 RepID=A0AAD4MFV9_9BILA|nr:7 transmembrane receptor (rhodopsin family) domain-containing protein [Ditylenchus destructor]